MEHWRPDMSAAVPLAEEPRRRRKRDWTSVDSYAPPRARPQHHGEARVGGWIGVALVGLMCGMLVAGSLAILSGPEPIDDMAVEP